MKHLNVFFITAMLLGNSPLFSQVGPPPGVFLDSVYATVKITTDITYGSNKNFFKNNQVDTLKLDLYEPDASVNYLRPVIVYLHAGGFTTGDKGENRAVKLGNYFAKKGYAFASINYRLGSNVFPDTVDNYQSVYQITQDAMSAVRFFRKNWLNYCIDTNTIFMVGSSAGAAICLTVAYWDQDEADQAFDTTPFGPLDQASGNEGPTSSVSAIVPCWGGMPDTSWLQNETEPAYLFHGTADNIVPYVYGLSFNGVNLHGSYNIHHQLLANGVESYLHPFVNAGHGVPVNSPQYDTLMMLITPFFYDHLSPAAGSSSCGFTGVQADEAHQIVFEQAGPHQDAYMINRSNQEQEVELDWISLEGKIMRSERIIMAPGQRQVVETELYADSLYLLRLRCGSSSQVFKLIAGS
ncbi:MAG: alpha/beta hydrolase [Chitinophagales bacterium]|nr:alpha/beta hydrolase [Chitinophagales bacterium]MDW8392638.1 alpha/beta hydrolase [Chitinophagales bacterium]